MLHTVPVRSYLGKKIYHGSESSYPMSDALPLPATREDADGWAVVDPDLDERVARWALFVGRQQRLAFKRRCWSQLGQWLKVIKAGQRRTDDGATRDSPRGPGPRTA